MSSKKLFSNKVASSSVKVTKVTDTVNKAGGTAYLLSDKAALAQLAMTGCFNGTYYVSDQDQLKKTLELANKSDVAFVAKLAVYARQKGLMKDMPAILAAVVASKDSALLKTIFPKVINDPKMLRNFVQIIRSGVTGRKSLGTVPKKLIQEYFNSLTDEQLFKADIGNDPSLQDIIKLVHPKPATEQRAAMFSYLLDRDYNKEKLCALATQFESFKKDMSGEMPDVPFQFLTMLPLMDSHWKKIAENATWNQTKLNLNSFAKHNVFKDSKMVDLIATRLQNPELVKRSKVFPYSIFTAYLNIDGNVPGKISVALQKAADIALENVPEFNNDICVMVDTSGSMSSPATGNRGTVTSKIRCIDVAALFASAIMRKNSNTEIVPFDTRVHTHKLNPLDSIATNAKTLAGFGGGGTDCSSAIKYLNDKGSKAQLLIMISDNESWVTNNNVYYNRGTHMSNEWLKYKQRNPKAKLVCWDITPNSTTQVNTQKDVLNCGGFSDTIFDVIASFVDSNDDDLMVKTIESINM